MTYEVCQLKFQVVGGGFCGGFRLACFAAFCMQMPSGADVATKAFRSSGGWQTLENVKDCRQVSWSVTDLFVPSIFQPDCVYDHETGLKNCLMVVPYLFFSFNAMWGTTCFRSCLGRTAKARDGTTARAAFRGLRSWCLFFLSRKRVKVSSTYIIPVQTDTICWCFLPRGWSFLTHVPTNVVTFGLFCPCFRFSSSKTKLLNCRLWVQGVWIPRRAKLLWSSLQFLCRVDMVGQEQRTAPDAAEQTEETQRLRAAEAQAQQQARRRVSSIDVYFILT